MQLILEKYYGGISCIAKISRSLKLRKLRKILPTKNILITMKNFGKYVIDWYVLHCINWITKGLRNAHLFLWVFHQNRKHDLQEVNTWQYVIDKKELKEGLTLNVKNCLRVPWLCWICLMDSHTFDDLSVLLFGESVLEWDYMGC